MRFVKKGARNVVNEVWVSPNEHHHVYKEAEPSTEYEIAVLAETGGGKGPESIIEVKTWPEQSKIFFSENYEEFQ